MVYICCLTESSVKAYIFGATGKSVLPKLENVFYILQRRNFVLSKAQHSFSSSRKILKGLADQSISMFCNTPAIPWKARANHVLSLNLVLPLSVQERYFQSVHLNVLPPLYQWQRNALNNTICYPHTERKSPLRMRTSCSFLGLDVSRKGMTMQVRPIISQIVAFGWSTFFMSISFPFEDFLPTVRHRHPLGQAVFIHLTADGRRERSALGLASNNYGESPFSVQLNLSNAP